MIHPTHPTAGTVNGPFSQWPRRHPMRRMTKRGKLAATAVAVGTVGFVHCILPIVL